MAECMRGGTHAVSARAGRGPSTDRLGMARMHAGTYGPGSAWHACTPGLTARMPRPRPAVLYSLTEHGKPGICNGPVRRCVRTEKWPGAALLSVPCEYAAPSRRKQLSPSHRRPGFGARGKGEPQGSRVSATVIESCITGITHSILREDGEPDIPSRRSKKLIVVCSVESFWSSAQCTRVG